VSLTCLFWSRHQLRDDPLAALNAVSLSTINLSSSLILSGIGGRKENLPDYSQPLFSHGRKLFCDGNAQFDHVKAGVGFTIVALLIAATYFSPHIWHHGEAREALVIQDIVENHRWVLPLRNGELPSKPILFHWIAASFALALGLSDFTVRLPSVVGAALLAWVTYAVGKFGSNRKTALLAAGILASTFKFWDSGTEARVDMLFAALIGGALASWYFWYRSGRELARAAAYLSIAFAVLAKGPAGAALPGLVIFCFLLFERDLRALLRFFSWSWLLVVFAIDGGWYLAAYQKGGADFWHKQIIYENVDRFFGSGAFQTQKNHFTEAIWLVTQLFPWSVVLMFALFQWFRGQRQDSFGHFLHAWWLTIFAFFLFAAGWRAVYLLPIYPAVALLAARELAAFLYARQGVLGNPRLWVKRWLAAATVIAVMDFSLGTAIPIRRTVQEDSSDQEEFVEEVVAKIPATAALYAAPDFPDTALIVLAYRLKRDIPSQALECQGEYYYLTIEGSEDHCLPKMTTAVAGTRKQTLQLLHVSNVS
jgi:4-amino-4-deoxy-L-arabinose transferase-like glycosyltransferase